MINYLVNLPRSQKVAVQVLFDILAISAVMLLVWWLDFRGTTAWSWPPSTNFILVWGAATLSAPLVMAATGVYRAVVRFTGKGFGLRMIFASAVTTGVAMSVHTLATGVFEPRLAVMTYFLMSQVLTLPRAAFRWLVERMHLNGCEKAIIYGAGEAGRELYLAIRSTSRIKVEAFIDDDEKLWNQVIHNLPVIGHKCLDDFVSSRGTALVLLAMPSISVRKRREIIERIQQLPVRIQTIPGLTDLISGNAQVSEIRDVRIEDLLGRTPVAPDPALITPDVSGKNVLVTGAGGSIGSEICRQALLQSPKTLVLLDQNEFGLYQIDQELEQLAKAHEVQIKLVPVLGSVTDLDGLNTILTTNEIDTVYHAAAYKHVPMVEANPLRGIENNILGTWRCANAAQNAGVKKFVLVSTDKAVRPTSLMGATKRMAELGIQALAETGKTRFAIVRFGNVLGSSGSVIPLFRKQIQAGGPVTVTHPDMVRYFMMIPEAAQLVIQAGALGSKGEVFVLDMGRPIRIVDLARDMIRLSGLSMQHAPEKEKEKDEIEIVFTGMRPGEKLYEELLVSEDNRETSHPRIQMANEPTISLADYQSLLAALEKAVAASEGLTAISVLQAAPLSWIQENPGMTGHADDCPGYSSVVGAGSTPSSRRPLADNVAATTENERDIFADKHRTDPAQLIRTPQ